MVKGDMETATINSLSLTSATTGQQNGCYRLNNHTNNVNAGANETNVADGNSTGIPITTTNNNTSTDVTNITDISVECPLCMENLDIDDLDFFPCSCGYQVCRFCWHRLKNDDNGLCPACRQPYPDSPIHFSSISIERVEELKKMKKKQKEKQKLKDNNKLQNLSTIRVVQKNLLFVIGIPPRFTQEELRKEFSRYGKIVKMVINASSAYVTYTRPEDAVAAIKTLNDSSQQQSQNNGINSNGTGKSTRNNIQLMTGNGATINSGGGSILTSVKASLGTTKYCTHWLRCQTCPKQPDCMYLHEMAEQEASFTKEEMQAGKHTEYEKRLIQHYLEVIYAEREKERQQQPISSQNATSFKQQTTQQQRPYGSNSGGRGGSNSPPITSNNNNHYHRKSSSNGGQQQNSTNTNGKSNSSDFDFNQYNNLNHHHQHYNNKKDGTGSENNNIHFENGPNNRMIDGQQHQRWLTTKIDKSATSTVAIKILQHNHHHNNTTNNGSGNTNQNGHNSDSSSGNSSLSSTPNHHHHHHHIVEPSMFSNFSSSSSSGTSSLSCDESSSNSSSSSSTPDNIQQQAKQQRGPQATEDLLQQISSMTNQNNEDTNVIDNVDDDDLDFDPISLSHRALEAMLRSSSTSSSNVMSYMNRSNSGFVGGNAFNGFMIQNANNNIHNNSNNNHNNNNIIHNLHQQSNSKENLHINHLNQIGGGGSSFGDSYLEQQHSHSNQILNRLALLNLASETNSGKPFTNSGESLFNSLFQQQILSNNNPVGFGGTRSSTSLNLQQLFNNGSNQSMLHQNLNLLSLMQQQKQHPNLDHFLQQQQFDQKSLNSGPSSPFAFNNGQQQQSSGNNKLQQWQQQQNSLRQLLPNVNIKFQQQQQQQQQTDLNPFNGGHQFLNGGASAMPFQKNLNHSKQMNQFWPPSGQQSSTCSSPSPNYQQMAHQQQIFQQQQQKIQHYLQMQQKNQQQNNLNQFLLSQMLSTNNNSSVGNQQQMRQQPPPPGFTDARL